MNKIVRNYPASKLPQDLRPSDDENARVTITIEEEKASEKAPSLDDIFAARQPPFRSKEQIDEDVRKQRDEWDG